MTMGKNYDDTISKNPPIPKLQDRALPLPKLFKSQCAAKGICCNCFEQFHGLCPCDASAEDKAAALARYKEDKESRLAQRAQREQRGERSRTPAREDDRSERRVFVQRGGGSGRGGRGGGRIGSPDRNRGDASDREGRGRRDRSRSRGPPPEGKTRWQGRKS